MVVLIIFPVILQKKKRNYCTKTVQIDYQTCDRQHLNETKMKRCTDQSNS